MIIFPILVKTGMGFFILFNTVLRPIFLFLPSQGHYSRTDELNHK